MTQPINARERRASTRAAAVPTHKFNVGLHVLYSGDRASGVYRVTRHLPDGGQGLQYRIQSDQNVQERVVLESSLAQTT